VPALTLNGLQIPIAGDSFNEEIVDSGDVFARATTGKMFGSFGVRKRRWSFRVPPLESTIAARLRYFLEGNAHSWNFESTLLSGSGVANSVVNSGSFVAGKYGNALRVNSATYFQVDMTNKFNIPNGWTPAKGWTIAFWSYRTIAADGVPSDGWYHFIATGAVDVVAAAAFNPAGVTQYRNGVAGNYGLGLTFNVQAGGNLVGVLGWTLSTNVGENKDFDDLVFLPYAIPTAITRPWTTTWAAQLYSYANAVAYAAAPVLWASGDHLDAATAAEGTFVQCRIERMQHINATLPEVGSSKPNVKTMDVVMEEF
jgi:hypothetical protein